MNEFDNTNKKQNKRGNPNWIKGQSANPEGRKLGTKNYTTLLEEAIKKYETDSGKALFDRLIQRAFVNDNVLLNVVKKFIPDKTSTEITAPGPVTINLVPVKTPDDVEKLKDD